jgi:hypothetical protein
VGGHARAQDTRRQPRLAREREASYSTMHSNRRTAEQRAYWCRAAAEAAAAQLRAAAPGYPVVEGTLEERPG